MLLLLSNLTPAFFFPPKSDETEKQKSLRHSKLRANPSFSFEFLIFLETQGGAAGRTARRVQHKNNTTAGLPSWTSHRLYRTMTSPSTLPSSLPSAGQTPVSITVSYWIPNDPQQQDEPCSSTSSSSSSSSSTPTKTETWDASAVPLAVLGLPAGRTPVKVCTVGGYSY